MDGGKIVAEGRRAKLIEASLDARSVESGPGDDQAPYAKRWAKTARASRVLPDRILVYAADGDRRPSPGRIRGLQPVPACGRVARWRTSSYTCWPECGVMAGGWVGGWGAAGGGGGRGGGRRPRRSDDDLVGYKRTWRGSAMSSFVLPVLSSRLRPSVYAAWSTRADRRRSYLSYLVPGLIAVDGLQVSVGRVGLAVQTKSRAIRTTTRR